MQAEVKVSICCLAYNHEAFIAHALDSFLMQETTFPYEILVHDDASTDGTAAIIRLYAEKYPNIVRPIFQDANTYQELGLFGIYAKHIFPAAQGRYVSFCEGDDYWLSPHKLQVQYECLERHSDCSMCVHNVYGENSATGKLEVVFPYFKPGKYTGVESLAAYEGIAHTTAMFCRADVFHDIPDYAFQSFLPDYSTYFFCATKGNVFCIGDYMSVWRFNNSASLTFNSLANTEKLQARHLQMLSFLRQFNAYTCARYTPALTGHIRRRLRALFECEAFGRDETIEQFYDRMAKSNVCQADMGLIKQYAAESQFSPVWDKIDSAFQSGKKIFIYGAGRFAGMAMQILSKRKIAVSGFVVTDGRKAQDYYYDIPVYCRSELPYPPGDVSIFLAIKSKFAQEVIPYYDGAPNVYWPFKM